jgi:hypothetical protein
MKHRDKRQRAAGHWVRGTFGKTTTLERMRRLLEETIELAQVEGVSRQFVEELTHYVYGKPVGERSREVGGVGLTLLGYCDAVGLSADQCEADELARVRALPREHFRVRQNEKFAAEVGDSAGLVTLTDEMTLLNEPPFFEEREHMDQPAPAPAGTIPPDVLALIERAITTIGSREPTRWDEDARAASLAYVRSAGHFTELGAGGARVGQFGADVADTLEARRLAKKGESQA